MHHVSKIIQIILTRCISSTMRYETWKFLSITQFISEKKVYIFSFDYDLLLYCKVVWHWTSRILIFFILTKIIVVLSEWIYQSLSNLCSTENE